MKKLPIYTIISCMVIFCMSGTSTIHAQTSDLVQIDRTHYGYFSIDNIRVDEKQYYKVIFMDVHVKIKDLALEDGTAVFPSDISITNKNGKTYASESLGPDCQSPAYSEYTTTGSEGGLVKFSVCYMVEKEFTNFNVYYTATPIGTPLQKFQIGNFDLTNLNEQGQPQSSSSYGSNQDTSSANTGQSPSIFEQFLNFLKQIFSQASKSASQSLTSSQRLTPTPNTIYTEDDYYAQLIPSNLQVVDKGRYNMISFSVDINVQDLPIEGNVHFEDLYTTLHDENSKIYQPDPAECKLNDLIPVIGKQSDSATYQVCYSVDKTSNKFSIFYTEPAFNYHMTRIGYLSVDSDLFTKYKEHYTSQPIQIGTIDLTK